MLSERVKTAYLGTYVLGTPFFAIYNMLPFILLKDLGISLFEVTLMVTLKPAVSLLSVYWSESVYRRRDRLIPNVILGSLLSHLPFLFFPWIDSPHLMIVAFALFMLLHRGVVPAWMEILKLHLDKETRQNFVAFTLTMCYVGSAIFPVFFGWMMDDFLGSWRWIFSLTALISMAAIILQWRLPKERIVEREESEPPLELARPLRLMTDLLSRRSDYFHYQIGFMIGGFGLMIMQPALPEFFMHSLELSYKELGTAKTMCAGIGFALSSGLWAAWMNRVTIFRFASLVVLFFALFPIGIYLAKFQIPMLFFSYLFYGVTQAGSELSWKLSGPAFSENEDSSLFSSINVFAVGLRGVIANPIGGVLCLMAGPEAVFFLSSLLCFTAAGYLFLRSTAENLKAPLVHPH